MQPPFRNAKLDAKLGADSSIHWRLSKAWSPSILQMVKLNFTKLQLLRTKFEMVYLKIQIVLHAERQLFLEATWKAGVGHSVVRSSPGFIWIHLDSNWIVRLNCSIGTCAEPRWSLIVGENLHLKIPIENLHWGSVTELLFKPMVREKQKATFKGMGDL